jgi:hypothetical protein
MPVVRLRTKMESSFFEYVATAAKVGRSNSENFIVPESFSCQDLALRTASLGPLQAAKGLHDRKILYLVLEASLFQKPEVFRCDPSQGSPQ